MLLPLFFKKYKFIKYFQNEDICRWKIYSRSSESPAVFLRASESYSFIFETIFSNILIKIFPEGFDEMVWLMTNLKNIPVAFLRKIRKILLEASSNPSHCILYLIWLSFSFPANKQGKHLVSRTTLNFREIFFKMSEIDKILALSAAIL